MLCCAVLCCAVLCRVCVVSRVVIAAALVFAQNRAKQEIKDYSGRVHFVREDGLYDHYVIQRRTCGPFTLPYYPMVPVRALCYCWDESLQHLHLLSKQQLH